MQFPLEKGSSLRLALVCLALAACGRPAPLKFSKNRLNSAPWCAPERRAQVGDRVVGHVHDGPKHKEFLVDAAGKEHDPEKIADEAWSFLERTGDARKIEQAFSKNAYQVSMNVVSINPVVVILGTYQDKKWLETNRDVASKNWYWTAQIQPYSDPPYRDKLQWFSRDLKQRPTELKFSADGVAQIELPDGRLRLIRSGDKCKSVRE